MHEFVTVEIIRFYSIAGGGENQFFKNLILDFLRTGGSGLKSAFKFILTEGATFDDP